ncbi:cyclic nucleotide-binding domain-containing protein [candidate division FCPU426 bacterium]|nr:cyclic nucleotide-binding domain-containing protein [candidate division FCPU426 bacterium]
MGDLVQVLGSNLLFKNFTDDELHTLVNYCEELRLSDGETVFDEGDKDDEALYFILEGAINILKGQGVGTKVLAVLGTGNFFGDMSFLDSQPRSAAAVSSGDAVLYKLTPDNFSEFANQTPKAALKFFKVFIAKLVKRLRETDEALISQSGTIITT